MKITALVLECIKGFKNKTAINLSPNINVFIGANNAGKSTIINSIYMLQKRVLNREDITIGEKDGRIVIHYDGGFGEMPNKSDYYIQVDLKPSLNNRYLSLMRNGSHLTNVAPYSSSEPENLIYPYLSKRKTAQLDKAINEATTNNVTGNFSNLYSKIDRAVTPQFQPANTFYKNACRDVLGYEISAYAKGEGKEAVYFIHNQERIPLSSMGEGIVNIVGLIVDLCVAENKIFLIEEIENDIHPKALKALLKIIIDKSSTNQFFISTHSNIVMKYLAGVDNAKLFSVTNNKRDQERPNLFISEVTEVSHDAEERRNILEEMGYDFFDLGLWQGWVFLEESSAETLIRDYFIKWYTPPLKGKVRTFSANGKDNVEMKFDDFNRLFVFLHLEQAYKNRVWVLIDGGEQEKLIIDRMKDLYGKSGWEEDKFQQLTKHDFEKYYPEIFQDRVNEIQEETDKRTRREQKRQLLVDVISWIKNDEVKAKELFSESAKEVIVHLKRIAKELKD